jgi:SnoaL-like domain
MTRENVEVFRRGWKHFRATGDLLSEIVDPDFVWDMSTFRGWPEQQTYQDGARAFLADWVEAWEDWELEIEELLDAGDKFVAIMHQHGRAKADRNAGGYGPRSGLDDSGWQGGPDGDVREPRGSPRSRRACGVGGVAGDW